MPAFPVKVECQVAGFVFSKCFPVDYISNLDCVNGAKKRFIHCFLTSCLSGWNSRQEMSLSLVGLSGSASSYCFSMLYFQSNFNKLSELSHAYVKQTENLFLLKIIINGFI